MHFMPSCTFDHIKSYFKIQIANKHASIDGNIIFIPRQGKQLILFQNIFGIYIIHYNNITILKFNDFILKKNQYTYYILRKLPGFMLLYYYTTPKKMIIV